MDQGTWTAIVYLFVSGVVALITYIVKEIVKPWSDAYLKKIEADAIHLEKIDSVLVAMASDTRSQSVELAKQTTFMQKQEKWWERFGSDPFKDICQAKAGHGFRLDNDELQMILDKRLKATNGQSFANAIQTADRSKENV